MTGAQLLCFRRRSTRKSDTLENRRDLVDGSTERFGGESEILLGRQVVVEGPFVTEPANAAAQLSQVARP